MDVIEVAHRHDGDDAHRFDVTVPADLLYLAGHFPDRPVLPAVFQLNRLVARRARAIWPALGTFRRAVKLQFRVAIGANDALTVALNRVATDKVSFVISRGEEVCSSGSVFFRPARDEATA